MFKETVPKQETKNSYVEVRELAPEKFWSGSVDISKIDQKDFEEKIKAAAAELGFTYSGYLTGSGDEKKYTFSRYPRRAFGPVDDVSVYENALAKLSESLGANSSVEDLKESEEFRVLLGLEEGYDEYKKKGILENVTDTNRAKEIVKSTLGDLSGFGINIDELNSVEEIKAILEKTYLGKKHTQEEVSSILGNDFKLKNADIYSVGSWGAYTEPALVIEGNKANLEDVYKIAEKFKQARIAVEDLQKGKSYMVETKYCGDPDKE